MHEDWCGAGISRIIPIENHPVSVLRISSGLTVDGVLGYVEKGGAVAAMFENFCTRNLCAESWDFIVAACEYEVHPI